MNAAMKAGNVNHAAIARIVGKLAEQSAACNTRRLRGS